ncbi:hypothetical protein BMS3Abin17_01175 [archaeon BMS3Abin17]|nr:hypothetical protein BMS3Abin17_01175 [archaeon BMS3Abin17]HDZ60393.1 hypothetical protein [Candidatus Pacearchaeota archaeon]
MRFSGAIYTGKKAGYLAVYNFNHDVFAKLTGKLGILPHLAHFSYSKGGKKGGVDVFLLNDSISEKDFEGIVKITKNIVKVNWDYNISDMSWRRNGNRILHTRLFDKQDLYNSRGLLSKVYDVHYEIRKDCKHLEQEAYNLTAADIADFCGVKFAKKSRDLPVKETVDKIIPVTKLGLITPTRMLWGGKQDFVPDCGLEANIDFGKGCISGFIPGEESSFDGEFFRGHFFSPGGECGYCYAGRKHKTFPKNIYKFDKKRLLEELAGDCILEFNSNKKLGRKVEVVRFGKRTEAWTPFTSSNFIESLEAMTEVGTRGVIPTKFLPFREDIAKLLKKTRSNLLYSIGFDDLELGASLHGCNNDFRLEQAVKYKEADVNSSIYLLIAAHMPIEEREKNILEFADKHKLTIQLLPMRFTERNLALKVTGTSWEVLKDLQKKLFKDKHNEIRGSYIFRDNSLICKEIHTQWLKLVGNNKGKIRMCHHDDELTYCGGCFQKAGLITKTVGVEKQRFPGNNKSKKSKIIKPTELF